LTGRGAQAVAPLAAAASFSFLGKEESKTAKKRNSKEPKKQT